MNVLETPLPDLKVVLSTSHDDARGTFARLFCARELRPLMGTRQIVQVNFSKTRKLGAIRGLHFQYPPHAEMKLVRCLRGRVWDVAVDVRRDSSTFLHWHAQELSPDDHQMMVIPEGFAHGFQVLEANSELLYLHTEFYDPHLEAGLRYDDPRLSISWPLAPQDISARDLAHPLLDENSSGFGL